MRVNDKAYAGHLVAVGQRVRRGREDQGWSVDTAATKAAMSAPTWRAVEHGQTVRSSSYRAIAGVLRIDPALLERAIADPGALDELDEAFAACRIDLSRVPHAALLAELDRRLSGHQGD